MTNNEIKATFFKIDKVASEIIKDNDKMRRGHFQNLILRLLKLPTSSKNRRLINGYMKSKGFRLTRIKGNAWYLRGKLTTAQVAVIRGVLNGQNGQPHGAV